MKERGILFSAPMVRALLDGRKTQTRRLLKHEHAVDIDAWAHASGDLWDAGIYVEGNAATMDRVRCPYGQPGDRLWVRETWGLHAHFDLTDWRRGSIVGVHADALLAQWELDYRADWAQDYEEACWRPSIHMPRWASRITLEVTGVRVQRLQDISEEDAGAEGVEPYREIGANQRVPGPGFGGVLLSEQPHRLPFADLWQSINGPESWDANPWVWCVSFRRLP